MEDQKPAAENLFNEFYTQVKEIEKRDSVLTSDQQIERLLRSGSSYFNLNPYEVLQVEPELEFDQMRTKYKRLSLLVHPDKNQADSERAQLAFDAVVKAWKTLENPETRAKCLEIVEEAKERVKIETAERRKKIRKGGGVPVDETLEATKLAEKVLVMKLFAEYERRRRAQAERDVEEKKRAHEEKEALKAAAQAEKEWMTNFEESREGRVASWHNFQQKKRKNSGDPPTHPPTSTHLPPTTTMDNNPTTNTNTNSSTTTKAHKPPKKLKIFRPPKHKAESR